MMKSKKSLLTKKKNTKQKHRKKERRIKSQTRSLSNLMQYAKRIPNYLIRTVNMLIARKGIQATRKAPLIGVSVYYDKKKKFYGVYSRYTKAVETAGGIPIIVPIESNATLNLLIKHLDGIVLSGGFSLLKPREYLKKRFSSLKKMSPARYKFDSFLIKKAMKQQIPILAICRGAQMLNEVNGGTTCIHIKKSSIDHHQIPGTEPTHYIYLQENTRVKKIFGKNKLFVNSTHQHCIEKLAPHFRISARASDDVIEAIESKTHDFVVGVQFHPEKMIKKHPEMIRLFKALVEAAIRNRRAKKIAPLLIPVNAVAETAKQLKTHEQKYLQQKRKLIEAGKTIERIRFGRK